MTALELAEKIIKDIESEIHPPDWRRLRQYAILGLASALEAVDQSAYERGVADGQALAASNQPTKGD